MKSIIYLAIICAVLVLLPLFVSCAKQIHPSDAFNLPFEKKIMVYVYDKCEEIGVPVEFAYAMIMVESGGDENRKTMVQSETVKILQKELNKHGANLRIDGLFGNGTEEEVIKFQKNNELTPDGVVGRLTWKRLGQQNLTTVFKGYSLYWDMGLFQINTKWEEWYCELAGFDYSTYTSTNYKNNTDVAIASLKKYHDMWAEEKVNDVLKYTAMTWNAGKKATEESEEFNAYTIKLIRYMEQLEEFKEIRSY